MLDPSLECDLPPVQHRQRSLPRTPREMEVLGEALGVEIDKGRMVISPRPTPRHHRTTAAQQQQQHSVGAAPAGAGRISDELVPRRIYSEDLQQQAAVRPGGCQDAGPQPHHHHPPSSHQQRIRGGAGTASSGGSGAANTSATASGSRDHKNSAGGGGAGYRSNQGSSSNNNSSSSNNKEGGGGAGGYRRRRREGGLRTRGVTRQSPVEERLSVHEDVGVSDAFDDDGLFQLDDNFAKFLDDKTSCQK